MKSATLATHDESIFFDLRRGGQRASFDVKGHWSYPAFVVTAAGELCWLHLVLGCVLRSKLGRTALFRPKAVAITMAQKPVIVRYENFHVGRDPFPKLEWDKPLAMFPQPAIAQLTWREFRQREAALLDSYGPAQKQFVEDRTLPVKFCTDWLQLTHPVFLPLLRPLVPRFVAALGVAI